MKFRRRAEPHPLGFQIAPMVDVLLVLLCFFILTWNFARRELEVKVTVPTAEHGEEPSMEVNQSVLNVQADGTLIMNAKTLNYTELAERMASLARINKDYAIILRGDENVPYKFVAQVIAICKGAGIQNVALPIKKPE
jgi:biopolymer transport protein ExbD